MEYDNFLKNRPIRVVWIGLSPTGETHGATSSATSSPLIAHTFCFVGSDMPKYIKDALNRINVAVQTSGISSKETRAACKVKELCDYFRGSHDKSCPDVYDILGLDLAKTAQHVIRECPDIVAQSLVGRDGNPRRRVTGGARDTIEEDLELLEIERQLESEPRTRQETRGGPAQIDRAPQFVDGGFTLVTGVQMYPEDSFSDVKRKIFVRTHIPPYRQHLAAIKTESRSIYVSYDITTTGLHVVDFRDLFCDSRGDESSSADARHSVSLFNIPIDRTIYDTRDDLRVEARDHITTLNNVHPEFFIVSDIAGWIVPNIEQIRAAIADTYQFELLYYGFVVKYFPQLTRECFHSYITNESEMVDKYPDLSPVWSSVHASVTTQCRISSNMYATIVRQRSDIGHIIIRAKVSSQSAGADLRPINLRDFFDSIVCSRSIIDVTATVDTLPQHHSRESLRYELRKFYKWSELVSAIHGGPGGTNPNVVGQSPLGLGRTQAFPRIPSLEGEQGIRIIFMATDGTSGKDSADSSESKIPLFIIIRANGRITFYFQWHEEDEIDFGTMTAMFKKHTHQFVRELRESGVSAASFIEPITDTNMHVQALTVAMRWKRTLSTRQFRLLREMWGDYIQAGIVIPRQTAKDDFSFVFTRGISSIDMQALEQRLAAANIAETNHYTYLSVSAMRQKWIQNFAGRVVVVLHRATDIRFDVQDIYEHEYVVFEAYLSAFITNFEKTIHSMGTEDTASFRDKDIAPERRRLRRLQEIDPELYNLKKHGAPRVFAQKCQGSKQPVLYSEHEKIPRGAVKYWNFTLQRPAFYACPDSKYPYLNFIVNTHPRGYCIPCCGKMKPTPGLRHAQIEKICLNDHVYDVSRLIEASPVSYIMSFGKDLSEGRLSHLPSGYLRDTLNRALSAVHTGAELLVFGVPQTISVIHALRAILNLTVTDFISSIIRGLEKGIIRYDTLAGGRVATYFTSRVSFIGYLASIASGSNIFPEGTADFMRLVITDCVREVFNLEMIYLIAAEQAQNMRLIIRPEASLNDQKQVGFAIIGQDGSINPVLAIHLEDFARDGSICSRVLIPECYAILRHVVRGFSEHHVRGIDLQFIRTFVATSDLQSKLPLDHHFAIKKLYIGLRGLCYAVLIEGTGKNVKSSDASLDQRSDLQKDFEPSPSEPMNAFEGGAVGDGVIRAYIPIMYSSEIHKQPQEDIGFDSLDDDITLTGCQFVANAINNYIIKGRLMFHKIEPVQIARVADKPIGIVVKIGTESLMYCQIGPKDMNNEQIQHLPTRELPIDPRIHGRMLASQESSSNSRENPVIARIINKATQLLYPYYEYELFCVQFMSRVRMIRNERVRKEIQTILESGNSTTAKSEALVDLNLSRHDFAIISMQIRQKSRAKRASERSPTGLEPLVQRSPVGLDMDLDLDLIELHKHIESDTQKELMQWVRQLMEPAIVYDDSATVPTIITPCRKNREAAQAQSSVQPERINNPTHCTPDGKLMLRTSLDILADILAADLQNPLKRAYIQTRGTAHESHGAFADFTQRPGEILLVKKHEIQL